MKRNWFKTLIGGISLTSTMFIFQACYGPPQDFGQDLRIEGKVVSKSSGKPINGIKVSIENGLQYQRTDAEGSFSMYTEKIGTIKLRFEDTDGKENGLYNAKDTVITNEVENIVKLLIELEEKN